jgi:hypothetical protein
VLRRARGEGSYQYQRNVARIPAVQIPAYYSVIKFWKGLARKGGGNVVNAAVISAGLKEGEAG